MHKTVFNCMVGYNATVTTARSLFICSINFGTQYLNFCFN